MVNKTSHLTGLEIRCVDFLLKNISEEFPIRELARRIRTDYKLTHLTLQRLLKKGIVAKRRVAHADLCSLNLQGDLSSAYYVEMLRAKGFLDKHPELKIFFAAVQGRIKSVYYSLVVFGSLAKSKETGRSDLDLMIIAPNREVGEEIERIVESESLLLKRRVQSLVLDEKEFIDNLMSKKVNVVVEAFKDHLIIDGVEGFYNGVRQAR